MRNLWPRRISCFVSISRILSFKAHSTLQVRKKKNYFPSNLLGSQLGLCNQRHRNKRKHRGVFKMSFLHGRGALWRNGDLKKWLNLSDHGGVPLWWRVVGKCDRMEGYELRLVSSGNPARSVHSNPLASPCLPGKTVLLSGHWEGTLHRRVFWLASEGEAIDRGSQNPSYTLLLTFHQLKIFNMPTQCVLG